jgi:hypothetical protein
MGSNVAGPPRFVSSQLVAQSVHPRMKMRRETKCVLWNMVVIPPSSKTVSTTPRIMPGPMKIDVKEVGALYLGWLFKKERQSLGILCNQWISAQSE